MQNQFQMASNDIRDILNISRNVGEKPAKKKKLDPVKRPTGMNREVFALLDSNNDMNPPPLQKTHFHNKGMKHMQKLFANRKVRSWQWKPFKNFGRNDNLTLYHWRRKDDTSTEYPFAKYSKKCEVIRYNDDQYNGVLQQPGWTRADTDHLIELATKFDLRFVIMQDRWNREKHGSRSVEDLKERYYNIMYRLDKLKDSECETPKQPLYDADHERMRKEQLNKLYSRTNEEVEEEEFLVEELRKIEVRRKEREKKQQDLQRLIQAADNHSESSINSKRKKSVSSKRKDDTEAKSWRIQDKPPPPGVSLRSSKIKQHLQVGQKKSKIVEQLLSNFGIGLNPMPTEAITHQYNELRNDLMFLLELKIAQETVQFDIQTLKHRKTSLISEGMIKKEIKEEVEDEATIVEPEVEESDSDTIIAGFNLDEALLNAGLTTSCNRKRKAALEIEKMTSLLKKARKNSKG